MPPLPTTLDDESLQLISSANRHQRDLSEFQIPRLRTCKGPLSLQQTLAVELREDFDIFAKEIESLDVLVGDQKGEKNRKELQGIVDGFRNTLANLRKDYRAALLSSKRTIDSQTTSQREELLRSSAVTDNRDPNEKVTDDALMRASDNVTDALRRTIGLMQGELERSVLTSQMLDSSTATLRSTSSTHDTLTSVMDTSKQLITALEKADWLDRLLILSGLAFFLLVVLFILKQRIVDRGLRIAFWWTRFLPDFGGDADLLAMEKDMGAGEVVGAVVSAASSVVVSSLSVASLSATHTTLSPLDITATSDVPTVALDPTRASETDPSNSPAATTTSTLESIVTVTTETSLSSDSTSHLVSDSIYTPSSETRTVEENIHVEL